MLGEVGRAHSRPRGLEERLPEAPSGPHPVRGQALYVVEGGVARGGRDALGLGILFENVEREIHRDGTDCLGRGLTKIEGGPCPCRMERHGNTREGCRDRAPQGAPPSGTTATGIAVRRGPRPPSGAASAVIT